MDNLYLSGVEADAEDNARAHKKNKRVGIPCICKKYVKCRKCENEFSDPKHIKLIHLCKLCRVCLQKTANIIFEEEEEEE